MDNKIIVINSVLCPLQQLTKSMITDRIENKTKLRQIPISIQCMSRNAFGGAMPDRATHTHTHTLCAKKKVMGEYSAAIHTFLLRTGCNILLSFRISPSCTPNSSFISCTMTSLSLLMWSGVRLSFVSFSFLLSIDSSSSGISSF